MNGLELKTLCLLAIAGLAAGCQTEPRTTLRPIPPPPSAPPATVFYGQPGVVSVPTPMSSAGPQAVSSFPPQSANQSGSTLTLTNVPGSGTASTGSFEVTSNFQASPQAQQSAAPSQMPGAHSPMAYPAAPAQAAPQNEVVPEQPGPDYVRIDESWK